MRKELAHQHGVQTLTTKDCKGPQTKYTNMAAVSSFLYTICDFYVPTKFGRSFVFNLSGEDY